MLPALHMGFAVKPRHQRERAHGIHCWDFPLVWSGATQARVRFAKSSTIRHLSMLVHPCHVDTMYVERHLFDHKSLICCDGSQHHLSAAPTRIQCFPVWPARHSKCVFVIESICHSVTPSNCLSFFARAVPAGSCHRGSFARVVAMDVLQHSLQSVSFILLAPHSLSLCLSEFLFRLCKLRLL